MLLPRTMVRKLATKRLRKNFINKIGVWHCELPYVTLIVGDPGVKIDSKSLKAEFHI